MNGSLAAIGDAEGTVSIMQLCKSLYETSSEEKNTILEIFDRDFRRQKLIEVAAKQAKDTKGTVK